MPAGKSLQALAVCVVISVPGLAQTSSDQQELFSPYNARTFYELAYQLYATAEPDSSADSQALVFFNAALDLDKTARYILGDLIRLASRYVDRDYSDLIRSALTNYVDESSDLETANLAVRYLLEQLNSREEREKLLVELHGKLQRKNKAIGSELAAQLGLLLAEKADIETARAFLMPAYNADPYNKLLYAKLNEISAQASPPGLHLRHLRLAMDLNPFDFEAALDFAWYAESLEIYDVAAAGYEYSDLFRYLYPSEPLPATIYLPLALSYYNAERTKYKCLQLAAQVRRTGRFDLFLEAITAKAAQGTDNIDQARQIFKTVDVKAAQLLSGSALSEQISAEQFAWFYSFIRPDPENSLIWANKAYAAEPNSASIAAILAYSLALNQHSDLAKPFVRDLYRNNQIAALTRALIDLDLKQKETAVETLKSAIVMDPASFVAEKAKELLEQNGSTYVPAADPGIIAQALKAQFGTSVVHKFTAPAETIAVKLAPIGGTQLSYGADFSTDLVITNNSAHDLVFSDDGMLKGNIRVDAEITGDLDLQIPLLLSQKVQPSSPIGPGQSVFIPLKLHTGRLSQVLKKSPQAGFQIQFAAYLDPLITPDGTVRNSFADIAPATLTIRRTPVKLSSKFLQNRLNSLSKGRIGQKIKSAALFAGLLLEQQTMSQEKPLYRFMYAEPAVLKSALIRALADDGWTVKIQTTTALLDLNLDYELTQTLAANLNHSYWPVRMLTLFALAKSPGAHFDQVLNWTAKHDENQYVRQMALALGAAPPPPPQLVPPSLPEANDLSIRPLE